MLPKSRRIPKVLFSSSAKVQKQASSELISLKVSSNTGNTGFRASCVVSRKSAPLAVNRNLVRRRVYAVIKELLPLLRDDVRVVVYAKRSLQKAPYKILKTDLKKLLSNTGVLLEKKTA